MNIEGGSLEFEAFTKQRTVDRSNKAKPKDV